MMTIIIRSGIIVLGVLYTALSAAYGIGGATGMIIVLYAWLIVRPLSTIAVWVAVALGCVMLLHASRGVAVVGVLAASIMAFDVVRQYLARTNTRSRAVSGSIALALILCVAYCVHVLGTHRFSVHGAQLVTQVIVSVLLLIIAEWTIRRAERIITFFTYGSDERRHI